MKYLFFLFLFFSCNDSFEIKKCQIKSVERFPTPDFAIKYHHRVKTSCDITLYTIEERNVGDSVTIFVYRGKK